MAGGKIQKGMGTEELNALRCGTCKKFRMGIHGQMICNMTGCPAHKSNFACISHTDFSDNKKGGFVPYSINN